MDNFKFGRENRYYFFRCDSEPIPYITHTSGTSGSNGISYTPPPKQLSGIKKYYFKGKYPKPR